MTQFNSTPANPYPTPPTDPQAAMRTQLVQRVVGGAKNFYVVAALSVVNTLLTVFSVQLYFVVGLGISLLGDGIFQTIAETIPDAQMIIKLIDVIFSVVIAGIFAIFGYFGTKGKRWAYIIGLTLYALDTLLVLVLQIWMGLVFHLFFLWGIFNGLQALNQLQKLVPQKPRTSDFPQDIGVP